MNIKQQSIKVIIVVVIMSISFLHVTAQKNDTPILRYYPLKDTCSIYYEYCIKSAYCLYKNHIKKAKKKSSKKDIGELLPVYIRDYKRMQQRNISYVQNIFIDNVLDSCYQNGYYFYQNFNNLYKDTVIEVTLYVRRTFLIDVSAFYYNKFFLYEEGLLDEDLTLEEKKTLYLDDNNYQLFLDNKHDAQKYGIFKFSYNKSGNINKVERINVNKEYHQGLFHPPPVYEFYYDNKRLSSIIEKESLYDSIAVNTFLYDTLGNLIKEQKSCSDRFHQYIYYNNSKHLKEHKIISNENNRVLSERQYNYLGLITKYLIYENDNYYERIFLYEFDNDCLREKEAKKKLMEEK